MDKPEIKAGQIWVMRNRNRIKIDEILSDNGHFPVRSGKWYWQANGRYWNDTWDHNKDLIKLVSSDSN